MDDLFEIKLSEHSRIYKTSLKRIIEKYCNLQSEDGKMEVDLDTTTTETVEHYINQSRLEVDKLESESPADLSDQSVRSQDTTRDPQMDFTRQDDESDESSVSSTQLSVEDYGMAANDTTHLTVNSLDESQRAISETDVQPEDGDEELEMSLRSHGSSLVALYPSMINRIGMAWHRQHVTEAAVEVVRRYRRWRQRSNRSNLQYNTFIVSLRPTTSQTLLKENTNAPVKRQSVGTETTPRSPLQIATHVQDWEAQHRSPGRVRREQHKPILVMDFSEISMPKESPLNKTITMSEVSRLGEQPSASTFSPSRATAKVSLDLSLRSRRLSLTAHSLQADGHSMYASETTDVRERPDIYGSPVRHSPSQVRVMSILSRSPHAFSRSPTAHSGERASREPMRPRLPSTPPQNPTVSLRMRYPQDSHLSLHPQLHSPQSSTAAGRDRLRRHLSFDSSMPVLRVSNSLEKLDEDFLRLYHKFVCQNKSPVFAGLPCRLCARNSEASRSPSSSSLAALALSPHRSLLRKRHRELVWDSHPQSKRSRDEYCASSPGSNRQGKEMLRRRLSQSESEQSHCGLSYGSTPASVFQRFSNQQRPADAHQESWMSRRHHVSAADFSRDGKFTHMTNGSSPRY